MRAALAAAALALAACGDHGRVRDDDAPIHERWAVPQDASPECLSAARRASRFCLDKTLNTDIYGVYTSECTKARWDHARSCR